MRGLNSVGRGGLWPGFRTEFLRVPGDRPDRRGDRQFGQHRSLATHRAIAILALAGDFSVEPRLPAVTQAEIKPLGGAWFNAAEPAFFDLAWRNGEATVTQAGCPSCWAAAPTAGWRPNAARSNSPSSPAAQGQCGSISAPAACSLSRSSAGASAPAAIASAAIFRPIAAPREIEAQRRGLDDQRRRATDRGRPGLAGARHRCRHGRDRIAGQLAPGDPARPSRCATAPAAWSPSRNLDRPHQEDAVRASLSSKSRGSRSARDL